MTRLTSSKSNNSEILTFLPFTLGARIRLVSYLSNLTLCFTFIGQVLLPYIKQLFKQLVKSGKYCQVIEYSSMHI